MHSPRLENPAKNLPRKVLATLFACLLALTGAQAQQASPEAPEASQTIHKAHAIAMHGEPKYGPDFTHFDYVNPDAPKGGALRLASVGTFDSFNPYIVKGQAAAGSQSLFESLMYTSADEAFTEYCLICESVEWPEDRSWVRYTLREDARWHDGRPITVEDVLFSLEIFKTKAHPGYRFYYGSVLSAEAEGPRSVRFTFAETNNRELPLIVGQMPILPKHYWEGRNFENTTLEPPLGSGPYRVKEFEAGRFVAYERVEDYWAENHPVQKGRNNWHTIRYDYYRDPTIVREALKGGDIDLFTENQAKAWALDYDVPAVRDGRIIKAEFENERPTGMQSFVMNGRRAPFDNRLVRRALAYAFDFEWTNQNLFFGQYTRTESYFSNSELASEGLPQGQELEILEAYRNRLPSEIFTEAYAAPSTDGSGWPRANLEKAFDLLQQAGWVVRDMKLVNAETGRQMRFEILLVSPAFERIVLPFARNLRRLGIEPSVRLVDSAQYINRIRAFDFDIIVNTWGQSDSPGNEQRNYWSCEAAKTDGSRNYAGICDPVVDELIEMVIAAPDRESLVARTRALDRVLLWGHYVIPHWHIRVDRVAYWDLFGQPEIVPKDGVQIDAWWIDPEKAARLRSRGQTANRRSAAEQ